MNQGYRTILVDSTAKVCRIRLNRPDAKNAINDLMIEECRAALARCSGSAVTVVVLEGSPEFFCSGADFGQLDTEPDARQVARRAGNLYDLFLELATGPYVSIAHVKGSVNAGGVGLVAACDLVVSDSAARFGLSELLFGLYPACVLPFLIRRCGSRAAHYLTLTTAQYPAAEAARLGLVDVEGPDSDLLLRRQLSRLQRLPKAGVARYKHYFDQLNGSLATAGPLAVAGNTEVFTDAANLALIKRFVDKGVMPWE